MTDFFSWRDNWNLGLDEIDRQHAALAARLNDIGQLLCDAGPANGAAGPAMALLLELAAETRRHFADEEELMRGHGYPGLRAHHREHVVLLAELQDFIRELDAGRTTLTVATLTPLKRWLIHHVVGSDHDFARFLRRKTRSDPARAERPAPPGH